MRRGESRKNPVSRLESLSCCRGRGGDARQQPAKRAGSSESTSAAPKAFSSGANFRISRKPSQMSFSQSRAEPEVNAVIPEEVGKFGVSRGVRSAVSLSEDPSWECRGRRTATAVRKRPPPTSPRRGNGCFCGCFW